MHTINPKPTLKEGNQSSSRRTPQRSLLFLSFSFRLLILLLFADMSYHAITTVDIPITNERVRFFIYFFTLILHRYLSCQLIFFYLSPPSIHNCPAYKKRKGKTNTDKMRTRISLLGRQLQYSTFFTLSPPYYSCVGFHVL